jgi:tetratricopeptide (TPR) repeat protein
VSREFLLDKILGERGFSVADLTRLTKLGRSTVDDIRRKGGGRRENLDKIASALGLEYDDLYSSGSPAPQTRRAPVKSDAFDNMALIDAVEQYHSDDTRSDNRDYLYHKSLTLANKIGKNAAVYFDTADAMYAGELYEEAAREYARAILSLKPWHTARLLESLTNFLAVCEQEKDIQPVIDLFRKVEKYELHHTEFEIICRIATFLIKNRAPEDVILDCITATDNYS